MATLLAAIAGSASANDVLLAPIAPSLVSPEAAGTAAFHDLQLAVFTLREMQDGTPEPEAQGTGFVLRDDHRRLRAVTAYHVIADYLRKPKGRSLEAILSSGEIRKLRVSAFDVLGDLALLEFESPSPGPAAIRLEDPPQLLAIGTRVTALGNPLDLGMTLTAGHYSGYIDKIGFDRIHITATLNPGMSGGPALDPQGRLVGVIVSGRRGAQQVSFLSPAVRLSRLLLSPASEWTSAPRVDAEIERQLLAFQAELREEAFRAPWKSLTFGRYHAPDLLAQRLDCSSDRPSEDDTGEFASRKVRRESRTCRMHQAVKVDDTLTAGRFSYQYEHLKAGPLNRFQFNAMVESVGLVSYPIDDKGNQRTRVCIDHETLAGPKATLPVRVVACTFQYKAFPRLIDLRATFLTRDSPLEALVIRLQLDGLEPETAAAYLQRFLEEIR